MPIIDEESVKKHLTRSHKSLQILQGRLKWLWVVLTLTVGIGVELFTFWFLHHTKSYEQQDPMGGFYSCSVVCVLQVVVLSLAPLISDLVLSRVTFIANMCIMILVTCACTYYAKPGVPSVLWLLPVSVFAYASIGALFAPSRAEAQQKVWAALGSYALIVILIDLRGAMHGKPRKYVFALSFCPLLMLASCPDIRKKMHAWMLRWVEGTAATRGAASLACLVGRVPPGEVMLRARQRFRCIRLSDLTQEMMTDNTPNPACGTLAESCTLGSCDAFLSHSWHDAGGPKWAVLQEWGANFAAQHGREPTLWFDRCCIDQTRIDLDLQCLPVFLKGCQRLVVLCGPTYLSRLWCILEIFTHIQMGGRLEDVDLVPVLTEDATYEDLKAIEETFDSFDAGKCQCFNPDDKERMLAIIEAAFGDLDSFNTVVQDTHLEVKCRLMEKTGLASPNAVLEIDSSDEEICGAAPLVSSVGGGMVAQQGRVTSGDVKGRVGPSASSSPSSSDSSDSSGGSIS